MSLGGLGVEREAPKQGLPPTKRLQVTYCSEYPQGLGSSGLSVHRVKAGRLGLRSKRVRILE